MQRKSFGPAFPALAFLLAFAGALVAAGAQSSGSAPPHGSQASASVGETAGSYYKNVQILKDVPVDKWIPTMQFMASSLGVECGFCHVGLIQGVPQWEKDDKQPKVTARKMIAMTLEINKANFNGNPQITCYSCHRGAENPVGTPVIGDAELPVRRDRPPAGAETNATPQMTPDQLIEKYVQAVGGAAAVNSVTSRVETGKILVQGNSMPIEVYAKAPYKRLSITQQGNGSSITAFDETSGWLGGGNGPPRDMTGSDLVAAKMDADIHFPTDLKQNFTRLRVLPPEKIGDKEMYLLAGSASDGSPVRLYFDEQTGLLARLVRYNTTALGRLPTQIDYADYRDVDGVKIPFRWTLARVNGRFTIQIDEARQNVPIDDAKFAKPTAGQGKTQP